MKKYLCFVFALMIFLNACSSNDGFQSDKNRWMFPSIIKSEDFYESSENVSVTSHNDFVYVSLNKYSAMSLKYGIEGGEPNQFFVVSIDVNIKNSSSQNNFLHNNISLNVDEAYDLNGKVTSSVPIKTDDDNIFKYKRVIKLDNEGKSSFSICIGKDSDKVKGEVCIMNVTGSYLNDDSDYSVYLSKDKDIQFIFYKNDVSHIASSEINFFIEELSVLRKSIKYLVGSHEPYDGITQYIFTESIPYTALAGNPVYINYDETDKFLRDLLESNTHHSIKKNNFLFVLCHEMSHTFDYIESGNKIFGYVFDKEFFATLKAIYSLYVNGYNIDYQFLNSLPDLSSGIYNYESFLNSILKKLKLLESDSNWLPIRETLIFLQTNNLDSNNFTKFNNFFNVLSIKGNFRIQGMFNEKEWNTVLNRYNE